MSDFNPVGWFEIYVNDLEQAVKFYEAVLQVQLQRLPNPDPEAGGGLEMMTFPMYPENKGASGAIVHAKGWEATPGVGTMVYFTCEDCAVEASRVSDAGGVVEREKMSIGEYGFVAICKDPAGNMFGLHSRS